VLCTEEQLLEADDDEVACSRARRLAVSLSRSAKGSRAEGAEELTESAGGGG